jgi:hypothetical protein
MRLELIIIAITAFFIYNSYHNGKYTKMLFSYKKYFQMGFFGLLGISLWLLIKRDPNQCKNILQCANNMVKYMPIDKQSMELFSPIVDFTDTGFMNQLNMSQQQRDNGSGLTRMLQSGGQGQGQKATKRSVSETKKKYVASSQNWKCGSCHKELNAWFEVDHKMRLEYGGGNNVENLIALCRECHGRKTAMEKM